MMNPFQQISGVLEFRVHDHQRQDPLANGLNLALEIQHHNGVDSRDIDCVQFILECSERRTCSHVGIIHTLASLFAHNNFLH